MDYVIAFILLVLMVVAVVALVKLSKRFLRPPVHWEGRGTYDHEVETSPEHQGALFRLAGGEKRNGVTKEVLAKLHLDNSNRADKTAVRVSVRGRTVGYMSPSDARAYREGIRAAGYAEITALCDAIIVGGRKKGIDSREHFGILLNLPTASGLTRRKPAKKG